MVERNGANSGICNCHNSEYIRLRGSIMEDIKVAWNAIFSKIKKFDSSQINLVELIFLIVQEMKISRYSKK